MTLPRSKRQVDKLGQRMAESLEPTAEDFAVLHELLDTYAESLDRALPRILRCTELDVVSRVKNTETILEKLRRNAGSGLSSTQDLAGARVVGAFDRRGNQDAVVERLAAEFSGAPKKPRVIDRRDRPSHGYRAVHLVVYPDGIPIEIQVRSARQQDWAERFEKFADLVGRGVRYGCAPTFPGLARDEAENPLVTFATDRVLQSLMSLSRLIAAAEGRGTDRVESLLAIRDRWIVAQAFSSVDFTIGKLEQLLEQLSSSAAPPEAE